MIKRIATLTLLLLPFFCLSQSEELELTIQNSLFSDQIDRDIIDLIIEIDHGYISRTSKEISANIGLQEHRYSFYKNQIRRLLRNRRGDKRIRELNFLESYLTLILRKLPDEILPELMQKPSFNDLLAVYLISKLSYSKQGMSLDGGRLVYKNNTILEEETITQALEILETEEPLIQYYYGIILSSLRDKKIDNVNLDNIGLNHKEQSIVYYNVVCNNAIGLIEICAYGKKSRVEKVLNRIPNINGKHFTKFKPYIYEDEVKMELYNKVIQCYEAIQNE